MKKIICLSALVAGLLFLSACKKEECLKCTTTISGIATDQPEICDKEEEVLDAKEEEYRALVAAFANDGWETSITCTRQ